jgi:hypothetical protein
VEESEWVDSMTDQEVELPFARTKGKAIEVDLTIFVVAAAVGAVVDEVR